MNTISLNFSQNKTEVVENLNITKIFDYDQETRNFLNEYYQKVCTFGWNKVLSLFDQNANVTLKNINVGNEYDLVDTFTQEYIKKMSLHNINAKWTLIDNNSVLINTFGTMQLVGMTGTLSNIVNFTETFVLKIDHNNKVVCTTHMIDY